MKKKIFIVLSVIIVTAILCYAGLTYVANKGLSYSTGYCLVTGNGSHMLIVGNEPIQMSDRSKGGKDLFEGLESGDKIRVLHDLILETYPARTGAYAVKKVEDGDISNIPVGVLQTLQEMGWGNWIEEAGKSNGGKTDGSFEGSIPVSQKSGCDFQAQYVRTNCMDSSIYDLQWDHTVSRIDSPEALQSYYEAYKESFDLERRETVYSDQTIGFLDACDKYDAEYFEENTLLMVRLSEPSGSIRHEVTGLESAEINGEPGLMLHVKRLVSESCTEDMAEWHILVEVKKAIVPESEVQLAVDIDGSLYAQLCGYTLATEETVVENADALCKLPLVTTREGDSERVQLSHGETKFSIDIPADWEWSYVIYEFRQDNLDYSGLGITFWPAEEELKTYPDSLVQYGYLEFRCHTGFGVCGTGLSTKEVEIAGRKASQGTYDGKKGWEYIAFEEEPGRGRYVVWNYGADWLKEYMDEVEAILNTICFEVE